MAAFVLLHGFAQTPASWDEVTRRLQAAGHRTYVPDLYRRSDSSLEQLCAYIAEVVWKVAQADGAPVLVGYSMGGRIAAETVMRYGWRASAQPPEILRLASLAQDDTRGACAQGAMLLPCHPERSAQRGVEGSSDEPFPLAGLVLESAGLGPADEAARAALAERNGEWTQRLRREGVAAFMDWWETLPLFATQQSLPPEVRAAVRAERTSHDAEPLARSLEAWGAHHQATEEATLVALAGLANRDIPVRYLAGARDEKYAAVAARARAAGLPAVLVPDVGHNVHLEASSAFAGIVEDVFVEGASA